MNENDTDYNALYNQSYGDMTPDNTGGFDVPDFSSQINNLINPPETPSYDTSSGSYSSAPMAGGLDQKIVALAKAIRFHESGDKYVLPKEGSDVGGKSMYQYTHNTWKEVAGKFLGDPNAPLTPFNENKATYLRFKYWKDKGMTAGQIASMHNAGEGRPNAYKENWRGVNDYGVAFDTPAYVSKVLASAKNNMSMFSPEIANAQGNPQLPTNGEVLPTTAPIVAPETIPALPRGTTQPTETSNGRSIGGFLGNLAHSGLDFTKSLANVAMHPINTVESLGKLALGAGDLLGSTIGLTDGQGQNANMARGLGEMYKQRYGGLENIGETAYTDPVGVAGDLATLLSGGAGATSKLGNLGKLAEASKVAEISNVGSKLSKAGIIADALSSGAKLADPMTYISKAVSGARNSKVGQFISESPSRLLGITTGEGGGTFRQIYDAASKGRSGAVSAMRDGVSDIEMISKLDGAVSSLKTLARKHWEDLGIHKYTKQLDISPIYNQLKQGLNDMKVSVLGDGSLDFSRSKIRFDTKAQGDIQNIVDTMKGYGLRKGDRLAENIDTLKQAFASLYSENRDSRAFVEGMRSKTRNVLSQVPGYDDYAKNFGEIQDEIAQLKTEMSAGNKNASQTWRKISNSFRQVNTEGRQAILKSLNDKGISDLIDNVAGYGAKDWIKKSAVANLGAGGALVSGNVWALPAFSPRAVGEVSNFLGNTVNKSKQAVNTLEKTPGSDVIKYIGGQVYDKNKITRSATLTGKTQEEQ